MAIKPKPLLILISLLFAQLLILNSASSASVSSNSPHPIFINQALKAALSLKKGDLIQLSPYPQGPWSAFKIAGYQEPRFQPLNLYYTNCAVTMNLSDLWKLTGKKGEASFITLKLKHKREFKKVSEVMSLLGLHLEKPEQFANQGIGLSRIFERFARVIAWLSFGAGTIFLFSLMIFKTEEERKEMGYLQAIGIGKKTIAKLLLMDGLFLSLAGTGIGLIFGTLTGMAVNSIFQWYFHKPEMKFAVFSKSIYWNLLILGILTGILATLLSLARIQILKVAKLFEKS